MGGFPLYSINTCNSRTDALAVAHVGVDVDCDGVGISVGIGVGISVGVGVGDKQVWLADVDVWDVVCGSFVLTFVLAWNGCAAGRARDDNVGNETCMRSIVSSIEINVYRIVSSALVPCTSAIGCVWGVILTQMLVLLLSVTRSAFRNRRISRYRSNMGVVTSRSKCSGRMSHSDIGMAPWWYAFFVGVYELHRTEVRFRCLGGSACCRARDMDDVCDGWTSWYCPAAGSAMKRNAVSCAIQSESAFWSDGRLFSSIVPFSIHGRQDPVCNPRTGNGCVE